MQVDNMRQSRQWISPGSLWRSWRLFPHLVGIPPKLHHRALGRDDALRRHGLVPQIRAGLRSLLPAEGRQHGRSVLDRRLAGQRRPPPSRWGQSRWGRDGRGRSQARVAARCRTCPRFLIGHLWRWGASIQLPLNLCKMRIHLR